MNSNLILLPVRYQLIYDGPFHYVYKTDEETFSLDLVGCFFFHLEFLPIQPVKYTIEL